MRLAKLLLASALICFAATGSRSAEEAVIGAATIVIPVPDRQCKLDRSQPSDEKLYQAITALLAGRNRLLAAFADCTQLKDWRAGRRPLLDDFVQVQTPLSGEAKDVPGVATDVTKEICASTRAQGEKIVAGLEKDVAARIESVLKNAKQNELRFLGVVAEEPNACYAAMLQKISTQAGTEKTQLVVFSTSVVKGKIVYHYRFGLYRDAGSMTRLLEEEKKHVAAFLAANPQNAGLRSL